MTDIQFYVIVGLLLIGDAALLFRVLLPYGPKGQVHPPAPQTTVIVPHGPHGPLR